MLFYILCMCARSLFDGCGSFYFLFVIMHSVLFGGVGGCVGWHVAFLLVPITTRNPTSLVVLISLTCSKVLGQS